MDGPRQVRGDRRVVRDDDERGADLAVDLDEEFDDDPGTRGIQRAGGLVGEHDPWPVDDGTRDRDSLALPAGELVRQPPSEPGDPEPGEEGRQVRRVVAGICRRSGRQIASWSATFSSTVR